MSSYTPLWVKSNYSFLRGASHPEEWIEQCCQLDIQHIALTDVDGFHGMVRAHEKAKERGIHLLVGAQITVNDGSSIVLLAQNRQGYANLSRLITTGRLRAAKGQCAVTWEEICAHGERIIAVWGGDRSLLVQPSYESTVGEMLRAHFAGRLYALITRHRRTTEIHQERLLRERAARLSIPVVAGMELLYHDKSRHRLQDVLACIRHGTQLAHAGRRLNPNAEHYLRAPADFRALFHDDPAAVERTQEIAAECTFSLSEIRYCYPSELLPDGIASFAYLRRQTFASAQSRYPEGIPADVTQQLEKELLLIEELDYCGYFLTMWEIVQFCKTANILCQGRGSAANSAVCYCLGITAVDPVRLGLLFERFISRERHEPPDIDLDIEHQRREEVIQFVYRRYGRDRAAMVANVIRYRCRSALRDVGKAFGLSDAEIERLAKTVRDDERPAGTATGHTQNPAGRLSYLLRIVDEIIDFPRHLSIHPGGFLLGHEPVHNLVPIENATMENRTVIQWDKTDIEALGLFKVDLLGLGALTQLHNSFDLLRRHYHIDLDMAAIPNDDPDTFAMLATSDTVGVFQVESRAQMAMLPRMEPKNYYDLVIQISVIRPGPIVGGMVHPFLRRRRGLESVDYPHPSLEPILKKTLGVPLFQEQVMKLAMVAADYTPGEADQLRRDMAAWQRSGRIQMHEERLIGRMRKNGIPQEFAERVFHQISGFGEYGFPESHAASFALITYASAWLRCHYLEVFVTALLNALPMGFYSAATIIDDAKRHGVVVHPVDVCHSHWDCALEPIVPTDVAATAPVSPVPDRDQRCAAASSFVIRIGFRFVKGLGRHHWRRIRQARDDRPFQSMADFVARTRLDEGVLTTLTEAGAFARFEPCRRASLWHLLHLGGAPEFALPLPENEEIPAFSPLTTFAEISWDYQSTGHSIKAHPLAPLRTILSARHLPTAAMVRGMKHGSLVRYAGIAICRQAPSTASGVVFMTLEDETGFVNAILWPAIFRRYRLIAATTSFLGISGTIQSQEGVVHVVVKSLWVPKLNLERLDVPSRDFV